MVHEPHTGEMVAINQRACEIFGYKREEARALTVDDLIADDPPYDSDRAKQVTERVLREGPQTIEWRYQRSDGTPFWGEVRLKTIQFRSAPRVLAFVSDITDRKRYEQALQEAKESAKRASRFKSSILANLSHAVRTPLTSILGYAEILEEKIEGEAHRFAAQIRASSKRLKETYSGLLELADLDASTRELTHERVDVVAVVGRIVQAYRTQAEPQNITLSFEPPSSPCVGSFDRKGLVRIVEELVENALAFTKPGGTVRVQVSMVSDHAQIKVADTGTGIPEEFQSRMFEAFAQRGESEMPSLQGAGIGLTIVQGLADLMEGTVDVESEEDVGTTMTVRLPLT